MTAEDEIEDSSAPLIEHLAELRTRLIRSAVAFIVAMCLCFTVTNPIFDFLSRPICSALADRHQDCSLVMIKLQEGFFVAIKISVFGGFALSFPYIGYQLWRFVAPGLYKSEKNAFLPFLVASPFMFVLGAAFCYFVILPLAFKFFLGFQQGAMGDMRRPAMPPPMPAVPPAPCRRSGAAGEAGITYQGSIEEYLGADDQVHHGLRAVLPAAGAADADGQGRAGLGRRAGLGPQIRRGRHPGRSPPSPRRPMWSARWCCSRWSTGFTRSRSSWSRRIEKRRKAELAAKG